MSKIVGFDIVKFYKKASKGSGYLRLNYEIKRKYIEKIEEMCSGYGMKFYCIDAHHKEKSYGGSCCGLPMDNPILNNYNKCQFTEALMIAKKNPDKTVRFSEIAKLDKFLGGIDYVSCTGLNQGSSLRRGEYANRSLFDVMRNHWNNPKKANSPARYFGGILVPIGLDENNDIIYKLNEVMAKMSKMSANCDGQCDRCGIMPEDERIQ
jgi:hypothetical protein